MTCVFVWEEMIAGGEGLNRWQPGLGSQDGKVQVGTFQSGNSAQNLEGADV